MTLSNLIKTTLLPMAATYLMLAPIASACPAAANSARLNASRFLRSPALISATVKASTRTVLAAAGQPTGAAESSRLEIVGMWEVTQTIGGELFDHALQQLYADGNEMQNSAVVPPAFGNLCFGVWERTGNREFRLKHFGWNFDANGNFTGTFFLTATMKMTDADNYTGTFVTDTLQLSGVPDSNLHGEGTIIAKRLKVD